MDLDQAFVINGDDLRIALAGMNGRWPAVPNPRTMAGDILDALAKPAEPGVPVTREHLAKAIGRMREVYGHGAQIPSDVMARELLLIIDGRWFGKAEPGVVVDAHICCDHADGPGPFSDPEVAAMAALAPALAAVRRLRHDEAMRVMRWATDRATNGLAPF